MKHALNADVHGSISEYNALVGTHDVVRRVSSLDFEKNAHLRPVLQIYVTL